MEWFYVLLLILTTLHTLQAEETSSKEIPELAPKIKELSAQSALLAPKIKELSAQLAFNSELALKVKELSAQAPFAPDAAMLQESPQKLQQQAIQRQENYHESFLKTGDLALLKEELIRAEQESQACYQLFLQAKDYNNAVLCLVEGGNSLNRRHRSLDAKENYQKALELAEAHQLELPRAEALNGLANLAISKKSDKSMAEAAQYAKQAEQLCKKLKDYDCWVKALDRLTSVQSFQGNVNAALLTVDKMLALVSKTSHPLREQLFAYITREDVYYTYAYSVGMKEPDLALLVLTKAQNDLEQAMNLAEKQGYKGFASGLLQSFLKDIFEQRDIIESNKKMKELYTTIINNPSNRAFHPQVSEDVLVIEDFFFRAGKSSSTENLYNPLKELDVREIINTTNTINPFIFSSVSGLTTQGMIHEGERKYDLAFEDYSKAIELLEKDRSYLTGTNREALLAIVQRQDIYSKATLYLLQQKRNNEAFTFMERARARYTADLVVSARKAEWTTPQERTLFVQLQETLTQLAKLQRETANSTENSSRKKALLKKLELLEGQYQKILEDISHQAPHLHALLEAQPASLEKLQADMRDHQYEVLYYLVENFQVIVWHISSDQVFVRSIVFLSEPLLNEKIKQLQASFKGPNAPPFDEKMARQLFLFLIQPVLSQIKVKHLVIIPHKSLYSLPFQVLLSPQNQYLGELYAISYAPSATLLLELNKLDHLKGVNLLAVLDPEFKKEKDDVTEIQPFFAPEKSQVVINKFTFSKSQLLNRLSDREYQVVHLSLHGNFNNDDPMLSSLTLPNHDTLTAAEMFGLPLKHTQLVTLSACEVGQVGITDGNDVLGMQRALLYAGTQAMILPMWKVEAEATAAWMKQFYQAAQTLSLPEAAQRASLAIKASKEKDWLHPYYWGGFQLISK
jgi:CHAT domain-containing protein